MAACLLEQSPSLVEQLAVSGACEGRGTHSAVVANGNGPIAPQQADVRPTVDSITSIVSDANETRQLLCGWYRHGFQIETIPNLLRNPFTLDANQFISAIQKARGVKKPLTTAAISQVREEHARTVVPIARRLGEAMRYEQRLSDLVNEAYGLTPAEVGLMWRTAPPRMPIPPPSL
jgi:hypothetical protein